MKFGPMAEKKVKYKTIEKELNYLYETTHTLILKISVFIFIAVNLFSIYFHTLTISIVGSVSIMAALFFSNKFIKSKRLKLLIISFFWVSWYFLFIVISLGNFEVYNFYYLFLITLVVYQNPRIFPFIAFIVLVFNLFCFSGLWNTGIGQAIIQNYLMAKQITLQDLILHLLVTNLGAIVVWRISKLLQSNSIKNILNEKEKEKQDKKLEKSKAFAEEIAIGNFDTHLETDEEDVLGKSLESMRVSLKEAKEREDLEKKKNDFRNVGLVDIGKILRFETKIDEMTVKIISALTKYMKANIGALYLANINNKNEVIDIELKATYAYDRERHQQLSIKPGSGLVGTTFLERESIFLTEIPKNYVKIRSALGETQPKSLLFSPLIANDEAVGVIELASVNVFEDYEVDFVNTISETIASTIINIKRNQQTADLLDEAKSLTAEMQEKEEELKQNMEEMKATQEEAAIKIKKLEAELNQYKSLS